MQGRAHYYENGRADGMNLALATLQALGCRRLVLTNAPGSLREEVGPGRLLLLPAPINFAGLSPPFGLTGSQRFVDLVDASDPAPRAKPPGSARPPAFPTAAGLHLWFG